MDATLTPQKVYSVNLYSLRGWGTSVSPKFSSWSRLISDNRMSEFAIAVHNHLMSG